MADSSDPKLAGTSSPDSEVAEKTAPAAKVDGASRFTRRLFLTTLGGTSAALATASLLPHTSEASSTAIPQVENTSPQTSVVPFVLHVNGEDHAVQLEPRVTLLDALREHLHLFGTKKGCDHGQCGACTVHVNGRRINSCMTFAIMHQGDAITTIEGLGKTPGANEALHPVQQAFREHDGFQCGYCTPGQIMSAAALLHEPCGPDDAAVRECMSGNICRCGAYNNIVAAVQEARGKARS